MGTVSWCLGRGQAARRGLLHSQTSNTSHPSQLAEREMVSWSMVAWGAGEITDVGCMEGFFFHTRLQEA